MKTCIHLYFLLLNFWKVSLHLDGNTTSVYKHMKSHPKDLVLYFFYFVSLVQNQTRIFAYICCKIDPLLACQQKWPLNHCQTASGLSHLIFGLGRAQDMKHVAPNEISSLWLKWHLATQWLIAQTQNKWRHLSSSVFNNSGIVSHSCNIPCTQKHIFAHK